MFRPRATIKLKTPREIARMRRAGRITGLALDEARRLAQPGRTSLAINDAVAAIFSAHGARPLFLNFPHIRPRMPPFPAVICASPNAEVIHGIPNSQPLALGDILAIDTGCELDGWCSDAAVTVGIGALAPPARKLLDVTRQTLALAIEQLGRCRYWSEVAAAMEEYVRGQGCGVIESFVGHGIGQAMHEEPQVPNFLTPFRKSRDFRLEPGLVLAIEPMVSLGGRDVVTLEDGWTVQTRDLALAAHFEHTVAITAQGVEILTLGGDLDDPPA